MENILSSKKSDTDRLTMRKRKRRKKKNNIRAGNFQYFLYLDSGYHERQRIEISFLPPLLFFAAHTYTRRQNATFK